MDLLDFFRGHLSAAAVLDFIDWLPRHSAYHTMLSEDDELAEAILNADDEPDKASPPRLTEFGTVEEKLAEISDGVRVLTAVVANWGSGKKIKPPKPSPRPVTAAQRMRARHAREQHEWLKSELLPHKYGPDTTPE